MDGNHQKPTNDLIQNLKNTTLFKERFGEELLARLLEAATEITLNPGEMLFNQGDFGNEMYLVLAGTLEVLLGTEHGCGSVVAEIGTGQPVGEIQFLTGGKRTAGIRAKEKSVLLSFGKQETDIVVADYPDFYEELNSILLDRLRENQLSTMLPGLFGPLDSHMVDFINKRVKWMLLKRGDRLFSQGEDSDSLFILISGRLSVSVTDSLSRNEIVGQIKPGQSVGEMGMITGEPRTANIFAARDSQLVQIPKPLFQEILETFPKISMKFMQNLIERSKAIHTTGEGQDSQLNFALVPGSLDVDLTAFARSLGKALSRYGRVLHLSSRILDDQWQMPGMSQTSIEDPKYRRLSTWLDEQEIKYNYILYEADATLSNWTKRCLQQAGHVLVAAKANAAPEVGEIEARIYEESDKTARPKVSLVLLHKDDATPPEGTRFWLSRRQVDIHHHVALNQDSHFSRLARHLIGIPVGLVLGGGGARGFAHLGIMQALEEYGISVDMVSGTSIGSIMGAFKALGWDHQQRMATTRKSFVAVNPVGDYTLPIMSLVKSRTLDQLLQEGFGDIRIEDMWLNFFCVSSNLTTAKAMIHDFGPLWKACRASIALPGILMPVLDQTSLLVDGGVINNMPADLMRKKFGGFIMLVGVSPEEDLRMPESMETIPSSIEYVLSRIHPFRKRIVIPTILDIMMRTILLASINQASRVKQDVDYYFNPSMTGFGLMDFKNLDEIYESGYVYAKRELEDWKLLTEDLWEFKLNECMEP